MTNLRPYADEAKKWATSHVIAAVMIGLAVGFVLGLLF